MVNWYIEVNAILREIRERSFDAVEKMQSNDNSAEQLIKDYLKRDYEKLERLWLEKFMYQYALADLNRHIKHGTIKDYQDVLKLDIPAIESILEKDLMKEMNDNATGFEKFLHPIVYRHAYNHFQNGHFRDAVLNSIIGVFDLIRQKTGLTNDGVSLIGTALSLDDPYLILRNLDTESGKNDQKGFLQIFQGAYVGIRDPKSHTLEHDLTREKALNT